MSGGHRTVEDQQLYDVEAIALDGTPLMDRFRYQTIKGELEGILADGRLWSLTGDIRVEYARADMTRAGAYARLQTIKLGATDLPRLIIPHEVAHVVHRRSNLGGTSHGPEYRSAYVAVTSSMYGAEYGDLLRDHFESAGLPLSGAQFPILAEPIFEFPQLVRWL
jgi:hypothetical protein